MEPPPEDPGVGAGPSPIKVVKRARRGLDESTDIAVDPNTLSPGPEAMSFRDKVTGFWNNVNFDKDPALSDESDGEDVEDDPRCPTVRIPDSEKLRVRRRFSHAIIVNTLDRYARPEVEEDFGPWMQVKKTRWKQVAKYAAEASGECPTKEAKKGNSFSVLGDMENQANKETRVNMETRTDQEGQLAKVHTQPSININEKSLEEDLEGAGKENNVPKSTEPRLTVGNIFVDAMSNDLGLSHVEVPQWPSDASSFPLKKNPLASKSHKGNKVKAKDVSVSGIPNSRDASNTNESKGGPMAMDVL
ncbi:hypothetical protein LINPERPRIM_LOCUS17084 [Linum perenne]